MHSHCSANLGTCLQENGFGWPTGGPPWCLGLSYYWRDGRTQHRAGTEEETLAIWGVKKVNNVGSMGVNRDCPCLPLYLDPQSLSWCQSSEALSQSFWWELRGGLPCVRTGPAHPTPSRRIPASGHNEEGGCRWGAKTLGVQAVLSLRIDLRAGWWGFRVYHPQQCSLSEAGSCPKRPSGASEPTPPDSPPLCPTIIHWPEGTTPEGTTPATPP